MTPTKTAGGSRNWRSWVRFGLKGLGSLAAAGAVCLLGLKWFLGRPPADGGAPPRGYAHARLLYAAYALGELKLAALNPPLPPGVVEHTNLQYTITSTGPLHLDLYVPQAPPRPVPIVVFIHGGAWKSGKRQDYRVYTTYFASLGYATASISYRLVRAAPYPAAIEDVFTAVRWLREHAKEFHLDSERIALAGGSAGGHLALLAAYASPEDLSQLGSPTVESGREPLGAQAVASAQSGMSPGPWERVAAVIDFYGPADLTTPFAQASRLVKDFLQGKTYAEAETLYRAASPLTHLDQDDPPTLIFHGSLDDIVPIDQSDSLASKLISLNVPHEYHRLEGWPHTMDAALPVNEYCKARVAEFLRRHLGTERKPTPE